MNDTLLALLAKNQWRLDLNRERGWRCLYWCEECGLWRCVEDSGAYHPDPATAILRAAERFPVPLSKDGLELIAAERLRTITEEGFDSAHDDRHVKGELIDAAICYVTAREMAERGLSAAIPDMLRDLWPFEAGWWKPTDAITDLTKAGAFIAAEIDRRLRAQAVAPTPTPTPTP